MIWKGLSVVTNRESPIVVRNGPTQQHCACKGDLSFLTLPSTPVTIGDICVFKIQDKPIPIVHRVLEIHAAQNGSQYMLTKGDNNPTDDRTLYNRGQMWIRQEDVVGKVQGFLPHVGMVTILLNDHPQLKVVLLGVLALLYYSQEKNRPTSDWRGVPSRMVFWHF
ncbi:hypothetical protein BDZ88DRAFT_396936 [Geranomyces variabilis]|nr:hypothetical protein BDZ88DRAFT_396936 [Geranomyces variabilis]